MLPRISRSLALLLYLTACGSASSSGSAATGGAPAQGAAGLNLNITPGPCPDAGAPSLGGSGPCMTMATRSFSRDIVPLFNSCAGEVCHSFAAGAIAEQVGVPSIECCGERQMIEPGHPERSYVLQKLRGKNLCGGLQMPLEQAPFSSADLQTVSDWICQGANTSP